MDDWKQSHIHDLLWTPPHSRDNLRWCIPTGDDEGASGFEPGTIRSAVGCSTTELLIDNRLPEDTKLPSVESSITSHEFHRPREVVEEIGSIRRGIPVNVKIQHTAFTDIVTI
jgi:hypothetical protein